MPRITHKNLMGLALTAATFGFSLVPVLGHAQAGATRSVPFGMVGLARSQTARLNVVNHLIFRMGGGWRWVRATAPLCKRRRRALYDRHEPILEDNQPPTP